MVTLYFIANRTLTPVATFRREGSSSFALDGRIYVATLKCMTELTNV
jgi:hypothetical protein